MIKEFLKITDQRITDEMKEWGEELKHIDENTAKSLTEMKDIIGPNILSGTLLLAIGIPAADVFMTWGETFYRMGYRDGAQKPAVDELEKLFKLEEPKG